MKITIPPAPPFSWDRQQLHDWLLECASPFYTQAYASTEPIGNPYLEVFARLKGESIESSMRQIIAREVLTHMFAWAIPNAEAVIAIAAQGPIIEIGAGTGYWARLFRDIRADVVAFDLDPPGAPGTQNLWHRGALGCWTDVQKGGIEMAARFPDRALMLCWPPYDDPMAYDALRLYEGSTVIFVGELGGCTADESFLALLAEEFENSRRVQIPQFCGLHDDVTIWKRRA